MRTSKSRSAEDRDSSVSMTSMTVEPKGIKPQEEYVFPRVPIAWQEGKEREERVTA